MFLSIMGSLTRLFKQQMPTEHLLLAKNYLGTWNTKVSKTQAFFWRYLQPREEAPSPFQHEKERGVPCIRMKVKNEKAQGKTYLGSE